MRFHLEGGPFDGKVVELDCTTDPGSLTIKDDGTLDFIIAHMPPTKRDELTSLVGRRLCDPNETPLEGSYFAYGWTDRTRDDGARIYQMTDVMP